MFTHNSNQQESPQPAPEGALILRNITISLAMLAVSTAFPFLGIIIGLFLPFPIIHSIYYYGFRAGLVVGSMSLGFMVLFHPILPVIYAIETFIPACLLMLLLRRQANPLSGTVIASLITGTALYLLYIPFITIRGEDPLVSLLIATKEAIEQGATGTALAQNADLIMQVAYNIAFGFFITSVFFSLVCSLGLIMRKDRFGKEIGMVNTFYSAQIPYTYLFLIIAGITGMAAQNPYVFMAAASLLFFLTVIYALQGFLTISTFFRQRKTPVIFQVLLYGLIVIQPILALVMTVLGILDTLMGLRRRILGLHA
ncbi:DUF2232 domain-containing protein [Desulfurispira natronophila]|uniref:Uncharacterized protein YybS (DUF2232 family) n=1 Tax=Desulfurispira natronophila TaxID=682562 RepID=A0A7W7Y5U0_9BACT|nr:DUF2232 domain-containing protein [Desulfurispira natronophila]MBB5022625.1 uncharacterized protein YybS (DUF2232 family) [Desulfurispira natronophila]